MQKLSGLVLSLFLLCPISCAIVFGGSNLGFSGYPSHTCYKPTRPWSNDEYSWQRYKSDYTSYIDCMRDYLDNASNDIQRIKEKMQEAVSEAKAN